MSAEQSQAWLAPQLMGSVQAALSAPWILDIDTTIKPLYGKQSGAEVSYNPHKPGRTQVYGLTLTNRLNGLIDRIRPNGKSRFI
jgi:hypothetical protein